MFSSCVGVDVASLPWVGFTVARWLCCRTVGLPLKAPYLNASSLAEIDGKVKY